MKQYSVVRNGFETVAAEPSQMAAEAALERAASISERMLVSRYPDLEVKRVIDGSRVSILAVRGESVIQKEYFDLTSADLWLDRGASG